MLRLIRSCLIRVPNVRRLNLPRVREGGHGPSYYLIPEIPPDGAKEIFSPYYTDLKNIEELTPDDAFNGFSRLLLDFQISLSKFAEDIKSGSVSSSSPDLLSTLEEIFYPVEHAIQLLCRMPEISKDPLWPYLIRRLKRKMKNYRYDYFAQDPYIYSALLNLKSSGKELSQSEIERINTLLAECWSSGAEFARLSSLTSDTAVKDSSSKAYKNLHLIREYRLDILYDEHKYENMVLHTAAVSGYTSPSFKYTGRYPNPTAMVLLVGDAHIGVAESDLAPSAPSWLPASLGGIQNGGHVSGMKVNMAHDFVVRTLLQNCTTRKVRYDVWYAWVQRASTRSFGVTTGHHAENDNRMEVLRSVRKEYARRLGCLDFLSLVWRCEHVRSPESPDWLISTVLEPLREQLLPIGHSEMQRLSEWGSVNAAIPNGKIEAWDLDYLIHQYNLSISPTKPLDRQKLTVDVPFIPFLVQHLNQLASLFKLRLVPISRAADSTDTPSCFVEDATDGRVYGCIVFDVFDKPGRPMMFDNTLCVPLATHTKPHRSNALPGTINDCRHVALVSNFPSTVETDGISLKQWTSIAYAFGSSLQYILPRAHHHDQFGWTACLAPDMQYLTADLCRHLATEYVVPGHFDLNETGLERLGSTTVSVSSTEPITALPMLRLLYETRFDLSIWSHANRFRGWCSLNDQCWSAHMPFPRHSYDSWPSSALAIFGPDSQPGLQYQHIWHRLVMQDVLAGLAADGLPASDRTSHVAELLHRFRQVIIAAEDLRPPAELFRRFRGRDPLPSYLFNLFKPQCEPVAAPVAPELANPIFAH